jgi:PIN domain nuclease of toxin-antitoxin system
MNLLLDTHIWLWMHLEPWKLSSEVTHKVTDPLNELWLSPISIWELMLLVEGKKVSVNEPLDIFVAKSQKESSLREAAFTWAVVEELRYTLLRPRDPADRFLAATAKFYDLTLVTSDRRLLEPLPGLKVMANNP